MVQFQRLRQGNLHEQALEFIRAAVINGDYRPGDRLLEVEIAEQMGVSRGPIREAIRQLEQEGLVVSQPHHGTYVATISPDEVQHLVAVRTLLEGYAIRHAAVRAEQSDLDELRDLAHRMRAAMAARDLPEVAECVVQIHRKIVGLAGSPMLLRMWSTMIALIRFREYELFQEALDPEQILDEVKSHERLVEAVASGSPDLAEQAIVQDIARITLPPAAPTNSHPS